MSWKIREKFQRKVQKEENSLAPVNRSGLSVVLVYPNLYSVGMGNLGFQKIHALLNSLGNVYCDRSFLPEPKEIATLKKQKTPLFSFDGGLPLSKYDVIAFSVTYEMDYPHVLEILELARVPLLQKDRGNKDPFVLMGGVCPTFNPEPMAKFTDAFAIGEGEEIIPDFFSLFDKKLLKANLLKKISGVKGMYVPSGYKIRYAKTGPVASIEPQKGFPERAQRRWLKEVNSSPTATRISSPDMVFGDMHLIEINRGCGRQCRFCLAGYIYRPPRFYSFKSIKDEIDQGIKNKKKIGLVGSACSDNSDLEAIAEYIVTRGGEFSISSLRLENTSRKLLRLLVASRHKTLSVAPEAGTERLRSVINKPLSEKDLLKAVEKIFDAGIKNLKLYFLIGLPSETKEDAESIPTLIRKIGSARDRFSAFKSGGLITVSINPFIPKPFTPFQWLGMDAIDSLKKKLKIIKGELKGEKNIKVIHEKPKQSLLQALLSRGDRRTGDLLMKLHERGDWQRALEEDSCDPAFYACRSIPVNETLPWDILDTGVRKKYLLNEFRNFSKDITTPPCSDSPCYQCGDFDGM